MNAGHGTLGWTRGAGKAMAELISGRMPRMTFAFHGFEQPQGSFEEAWSAR